MQRLDQFIFIVGSLRNHLDSDWATELHKMINIGVGLVQFNAVSSQAELCAFNLPGSRKN